MGRRIGFVGHGHPTQGEAGILFSIGRCIARFGHTLIISPVGGTVTAIREGVESEGGRIEELPEGILDTSDHCLLYPDPQLLKRLKSKYADIETNNRYSIITPETLMPWYDAIRTVLTEKGIAPPD